MRIELACILALVVSCGGAEAPPSATPAASSTDDQPVTTPAAPQSCSADEAGEDSFKVGQNERIGALRLGASAAEVKDAVGEPGEIKGPFGNEVEGGFDWRWSYPAKGLALSMHAESETGAPVVNSISLGKGATLTTRFGVSVGSPVADVESAYGPCMSQDSSDTTKVAGSVYGGVIFEIEGGAVASIFVGAAAE